MKNQKIKIRLEDYKFIEKKILYVKVKIYLKLMLN